MQRLKVQNDRLRAGCRADVQQFNAFKALEDPAHRRSVGGLVDLIGNGLPRCCQLLTQTMFCQTVHQQREHHDQAQRHNPFRFFHKDRGGQEQGIFEETKPSFHAALLQVQADHLLVGDLSIIHHIAGNNAHRLYALRTPTACFH